MGVRPVKFIEEVCVCVCVCYCTHVTCYCFLIVAFESYLISAVCIDRVLSLPSSIN